VRALQSLGALRSEATTQTEGPAVTQPVPAPDPPTPAPAPAPERPPSSDASSGLLSLRRRSNATAMMAPTELDNGRRQLVNYLRSKECRLFKRNLLATATALDQIINICEGVKNAIDLCRVLSGEKMRFCDLEALHKVVAERYQPVSLEVIGEDEDDDD
jgi:hypothetical protein